DLLGERDLLLFPAEPGEPAPRTRSRRLIGYVTRDPEVMRLALLLADVVESGWDHPMVVAARWVQAGHSADAAMPWITAGMNWPKAAETVMRKSCARPG
ncbi:MAG: hypothetical protein ACRDRF_01665, partial [Pseudonocardiaceae bacterium]